MKYVANDGKIFDREEDCTAYEQAVQAGYGEPMSGEEFCEEVRRKEIKRLAREAIQKKKEYEKAQSRYLKTILQYVVDTGDYEFGIDTMDSCDSAIAENEKECVENDLESIKMLMALIS